MTARRALTFLVLAHLVLVVARMPRSVVQKRLGHVARYHEVGAVRYHLDNEHQRGAAAVTWILENTPADAVVLYAGDHRGALEFVPVLIWPRLLVAAAHVEPGAVEFAGRRIARGAPPGLGEGRVVVVGHGEDLALEVR